MTAPTNIAVAVLWLIGGLALFLYGIEMMGDALRRAAGPGLRILFDRVSGSRLRGLAAGTVVTALIQSSSAATVMVVGFINAGLLTFERSVALILGANLGATITPMITALDLDELALPLLGLGFVVYLAGRKRIWHEAGFACMGLGMLFFGLSLMKLSMGGYSDEIREWLNMFATAGPLGYVLAFLVAAVATAVIQSSAATIVMIQALAFEGALTRLDTAIPMIIGAQVGTCITAILASLRGSLSAKRAALAHLFFNVIGGGVAFALLPVYVRFIPLTAATLPVQAANAHLIIRLMNVLLFTPFAPLLARLVMAVARGKDRLNATPEHLDFRKIDEPETALESVNLEIRALLDTCMEVLNDAVDAFLARDDAAGRFVSKRETLIDDMQQTIAGYLVRVSKHPVPPELAPRPSLLMHILSDVERIGDHAENIVELADMQGGGVGFSQAAVDEVRELQKKIEGIGRPVRAALDSRSEEDMREVLRLKVDINEAVDRMLDNHATRLTEGACNPIGGMIFVELVTNLRRVANHLRNIAASATSRTAEPSRQIQALKEELMAEAASEAK